MCNCKGLRGPQGEQGIQGEQGDPGDGAIQAKIRISPVAINVLTDISMFVSAASTGSIAYYGVLQLASTASVVVTITPIVNGVANTASALVHVTNSKNGLSYAVIPIEDLQAITSGQSFALRIELDDYGLTTTVGLRLNYFIQP